MKPSSAKQKGKRLEQKIASAWRSKVGYAIKTPGSGNGKHKGDVYNEFYTIEAKNCEKVKLWEWWDQARGEHHLGKPPVLMISGNYRPILAVIDLDEFLNLVKEAKLDK